jgi:hypothetical protein
VNEGPGSRTRQLPASKITGVMTAMILLMLAALGGQPAAPAPASLHAVSATKAEITLAWQSAPAATGYIVESLGANKQWQAVGPPRTEAAATMPAEQFATYTLRVRAVGANGVNSAPSNEITVGPPPTGFHGVTPLLKTLAAPAQFAPNLTMALDDNGDPAFAYTVMDPNNDQDVTDSRVDFVAWSRADYRWKAPVTIEMTGDITANGAARPISFAADTTTHRFGIAYLVAPKTLKLALSDDAGTTWTSQVISQDEGGCDSPALAMAAGRIHLAYYHAADGVRYRAGAATDPVGTWAATLAPKLPGGDEPKHVVDLQLDAAGAPAIAYLLDGEGVQVAFWRPGASVVKVADSNGNGTDDPDLRLTFHGRQPSLIFYMKRDDQFFQNHDQIWVARSTNEGASWDKPVALPNDGGNSMGFPVSIAVASNGSLAASAHVNGGNQDGARCGQPKLIASTDAVRWTICAAGSSTGSPATGITEPHLLMSANDKLYIGFVAAQSGGGVPAGIVLWREP